MRYSTSSETVAGPRNLAFRELCLAIKCPCVYLFLEFLDVCGQEHPQETLRQRAKEAEIARLRAASKIETLHQSESWDCRRPESQGSAQCSRDVCAASCC